ncbi:MAG TPA: hypothetical protein VM370_11800, partial [Candidatus Thermoplasmatota archaeon]|nr:hypothetical protein [Candidatus Thermoplasmatota archaeon]
MRKEESLSVADAEALANELKALASPLRLAILWSLRFPKKVADIRLPAGAEWAGFQAERSLTRSTVTHHVELLAGEGFVERVDEEGRYVVNQQRMFSFLEGLGGLARLKPVVDLDVRETVAVDAREPPPLPTGPRLLLVSGPKEGQALAFDGEGPWTIGRGPTAHLRLEYDPHVSRAHVVVSRDAAGALVIERAAEAKNVPLLNYRALP